MPLAVLIRRYLRDLVFGAVDGAVTTFAVVAGAVGADLGGGVILVLGVANLIADGFSMGVSNYLGTNADQGPSGKPRREHDGDPDPRGAAMATFPRVCTGWSDPAPPVRRTPHQPEAHRRAALAQHRDDRTRVHQHRDRQSARDGDAGLAECRGDARARGWRGGSRLRRRMAAPGCRWDVDGAGTGSGRCSHIVDRHGEHPPCRA